MTPRIQIVFTIALVIYLGLIVHLLKKNRLNLKYTLLWLFAEVVLLIVTIFPNIMYLISKTIGIDTPINSAFLLAGMFIVGILISITSIVSGLNQKVRILTQQVALLEKKIRDLSKEIDEN